VSGQHLTRRPFLGVQVSQVTDSIARLNRQQQPKGAFVVRVIPNSTSATLAIQPGDIIVQLNDRVVAQWSELPTLARSLRTDERVQVTLVRQGKQQVLTGKVQPMPYETGQNAEVVYGEVPVVGGYARSILKKPKGQGPFPTVTTYRALVVPAWTTYPNATVSGS
jgi:C-terminal processing protease CtpA/Prc